MGPLPRTGAKTKIEQAGAKPCDGNTSGEGAVPLFRAVIRPRAIAPQWGEPMGSLPRTGAKTKIEQT